MSEYTVSYGDPVNDWPALTALANAAPKLLQLLEGDADAGPS